MASTRRLTAILAADVAGYSRLMGADEEGTHERLKAHLGELIHPTIKEHRGRTVKNTGDGFLAEFASVVDAVRCAVEVQRGMIGREPQASEEQRIRFRIGVNLGDVIAEEHDIFGDGVNIAARLEALAEPGEICVSRMVYDQVRDKLDLRFEDRGEHQVKNIVRPVHVYRIPLQAEADEARSEGAPPPPLPDKPSIAVLPFANLSGDPEQDYFVDGMVEEIITALSRIRWLCIIARNARFTHEGQMIDVKLVGRELGVRYVLEGSVRKSGNRVRITAQLIDVTSRAHLWADRFDGSLEDVFDLQDKVASRVAAIIEPALQAAETRRSAATRPTSDLRAYDLYLRAVSIYAPLSREGITQALALLEQAIGRDPRYGPALSLAACMHLRGYLDGWAEDSEIARRKGVALARRALEIAPDDPVTIAQAAYALAEFGEDVGAMIALIDRSLTFNPNSARGWFLSGAIRVDAGQPDLAIEHVETSLRLSLRDRIGAHFSVIGSAYFFLRRFEEAVPKLLVAIQEHPGHPFPYRLLAACYVHMGRLDEAREIVKRLRAITPIVVPTAVPYSNPDHRELFLSGLRVAAGGET
jgi:adenylate cyclase